MADKKGLFTVLAIAGVTATAILLGKRPPTPPGEGGADVDIFFTPVAKIGRYVGAFGPDEPVLEGQQTLLTVTVKNTSTQDGQPVAASLTTKIDIKTTDGTVVLPVQTMTDNYAANGTKTYQYTVTAPLGKGGQSLGGYAGVYDPNGVFLASGAATQPIASISISVTIPISYIYYPALGYWAPMAPTQNVPYATAISIGFSWKNSSNIPIVGRAALKVVYPDGSIVYPNVSAGQDQTGSIGALVTGVVFNSFGTTQVGTYTLTETLSYQGVVLATATHTVVVQPLVTLPTVQTIGASAITTNSATLRGYVSAKGTPPPGHGQWVIIGYGKINKAGVPDWDYWTDWAAVIDVGYYDFVVSGLDPGSTYYFEMLGTVGGVTPKIYSFGGGKSFRTQSPIVYGATVAIS